MTTFALITILTLFGSWSVARFSVSWLHWAYESIRTCFSWSVSDNLWPAATTLSTHDLDPDCSGSAATFLVQWTQAHWNVGMQATVWWIACMALRPAWTWSRCSRYGELPVVNCVQVRSHRRSNKHYFSTWLHKHKFWNSDRNHRPNALREMFSSLQHSLGRHSLFDLTCWISSGLTIMC